MTSVKITKKELVSEVTFLDIRQGAFFLYADKLFLRLKEAGTKAIDINSGVLHSLKDEDIVMPVSDVSIVYEP